MSFCGPFKSASGHLDDLNWDQAQVACRCSPLFSLQLASWLNLLNLIQANFMDCDSLSLWAAIWISAWSLNWIRCS